MNELPCDWAKVLMEAYPDRSGVNGWGSVRLLLVLRSALQQNTWQEVIDGCQRYKEYCQKTGIEGSVYVQAPYRFISEQSYLETFEHKAPEDPKIIEARTKEQTRWAIARSAAGDLPQALEPYPLESVGSFETRIETSRTRGPNRIDAPHNVHPVGEANHGDIHGRIADLTQRLRIAK